MGSHGKKNYSPHRENGTSKSKGHPSPPFTDRGKKQKTDPTNPNNHPPPPLTHTHTHEQTTPPQPQPQPPKKHHARTRSLTHRFPIDSRAPRSGSVPSSCQQPMYWLASPGATRGAVTLGV